MSGGSKEREPRDNIIGMAATDGLIVRQLLCFLHINIWFWIVGLLSYCENMGTYTSSLRNAAVLSVPM